MDYYDFFQYRKYIINQTEQERTIIVKIGRQTIILQKEYCDSTRHWQQLYRASFNIVELNNLYSFLYGNLQN